MVESDNKQCSYNNYKFTLKNKYLKTDIPSERHSSSTPPVLVLDNGSFRSVFGYSNEFTPRISCPPITASIRSKSKSAILAGNDVGNYLPVVPSILETPFTDDIVCNFDKMENLFDYLFDSISLNEKHEAHPIVVTESFCNLSNSRNSMAELLFETYGVSSLCFGIDFLFSYLYNSLPKEKEPTIEAVNDFISNGIQSKNDIIISTGHNSSVIVPFSSGNCNLKLAKKVPIGGKTTSMFLRETLNQKYPKKTPLFSEKTIFRFLSESCFVSGDFSKDLEECAKAFENGIVSPFSDNVSFWNTESNECFYSNFKEKIKLKKDPSSDSKIVRIRSYDDLEVARQMSQLLSFIWDRKKTGIIEYAIFLRLIDGFGIDSEEKLNDILEKIYERITKISERYPFTINHKLNSSERVKTREHSRKNRDAKQKRIRNLSEITDRFSEIKTKYWSGSKLLTASIKDEEDIAAAISEFKSWNDPKDTFKLNVERFRTPEIFFQPSLVGYQNIGGIGDALRSLIESKNDYKNIFVTGGPSKFKGFIPRIEAEAKSCFQPGEHFSVFSAEDSVFDAWKGARLFAGSDLFSKSSSTIEEYKEKGVSGLFKTHCFSNVYPEISPDDVEEFEF